MNRAAGVGRLSEEEKLRLGGDIQRRVGVKTSRNEPLARFTTMRVGGPADLFAEVHNLFELRGIARFARSRDLPLLLIGRGSDLVVSDRGVGGLVVLVRALGMRVEGNRLVADAGVQMARAASVSRDAALSGLEFGLAIPGSVGGAVWANAGAHGSDVRERLVSASVIGADGQETTRTAAELGLAYRESSLKHAPEGRPEVVTQAVFELLPEDPVIIESRLDEIRRWRREHQPLGLPSAGSVFRNPPGGSAGRIIEELGLKGRRQGGAVVSEKHANFIVNDARGRAADVRRLAEDVRATVLRERGIELVLEVLFVGDWSDWEAVE
jgi:UDP-N-acetylmuramate dehydrogenase